MLPPAFIGQMQALLGSESEAFFDALLRQPAPPSIRLNPAKRAALPHAPAKAVPWCAHGFYLAQRPASFTLDPLLHAGAYYVQEASSMFIAHLARQLAGEAPLAALDLCAAPGGKATLLASCLPEGSLIVANEAIRGRGAALAENVTKWGNPHVVVTRSDPKDFARLPGFFDLALVDAPCSGEGMFRKGSAAAAAWSEAAVRLCAERQRRIVADAWPALRAGGLLLYCTCTFNERENEDNARWIAQQLGAERLHVPLPAAWGVAQPAEQGGWGYRFFPHRVEGEGFFVAALRKTAAAPPRALPRGRGAEAAPPRGVAADLRRWLSRPDELALVQRGELVCALPARLSRGYSALCAALSVAQGGVALAEARGRGYAPTAALALSTALNPAAFPALDVGLRSALLYLKREPFPSGSGAFTSGEGAFTSGEVPFTSGSGALTSGEVPLTSGSGALTSGEVPLTSGSGALTSGSGALTSGSGALTSGSGALTSGSGALPRAEAARGYELVRYGGLPLGFVKNVGSRRNNLYPQAWRVRMPL